MISMSLCTVFSRLFNLLDIYAVFPFLNILYWTYIWNKPYAEIKSHQKMYVLCGISYLLKPMIHITNLYNLSKANRFFCIARIPKVISTSWYMCGCVYMYACIVCVYMCVRVRVCVCVRTCTCIHMTCSCTAS